MGYTSPIAASADKAGHVINESNWKAKVGPHRDFHVQNGLILPGHIQNGEVRLLAKTARPADQQSGNVKLSTPFNQSSIMTPRGAGVAFTEADLEARVKELDESESGVECFCDFPPWDQDGLPYCWCNGGTQAASTKRRMQGHKFVHFSAASVGGPVSGYRSVGGWGGDTLKYLVEHGAVDDSLWPNNAIKSSLDTAETQANRLNHKVLEFIEAQTWLEQLTLGALGFPSSCDYAWWSHVVEGCRPVMKDGALAWLIRNSWGDWGTKNKWGFMGFAVLEGSSHAMGDPCLAVRQVTAAAI